MEFWNEIIHTALLGTDKKQVGAGGLPAGLAETADLLATRQEVDKEERFLQLAAVAFNYRQSGRAVLYKEGIAPAGALPEERPYCSVLALRTLKDILGEDNMPLLAFWLRHCTNACQLVTPDWIPVLMNRAVNHPTLQADVRTACGRRGEWLMSLNPSWSFLTDAADDEQWRTGTAEQRRNCLRQWRKTDPAKAREMLAESWAQENANSKADLLKQLHPVIAEDGEWLESLLDEKSQKVKDEVLRLLKRLPGSSVIGLYWQVVQQAVTLKKEKALLGMMTRNSLQVQPPAVVEEAIFKTGIEKLSSDKAIKDDEFILIQLMEYIPPAYWEEHFGVGPDEIVGYFQKEAVHKKFIPALVRALVRFGDVRWAVAFMQHSVVFYIDVIPLLPVQQQEYYSLKFFDRQADSIVQYARQREEPWSLELAKAILKHTAKQGYQYPIGFYKENIYRLPPGISAVLMDCLPSEPQWQPMWEKTSAELARLIGLKEQTTQAFNE